MSEAPETDDAGRPTPLAIRLKRAQRRILCLEVLSGAGLVAALAAGAVLAVFAADRVTLFPRPMRFLVMAAFIVSTVAFFYARVLAALLRPPDARDAARLLETACPSLEGFALSAAELSLLPQNRSLAPSADLVEATVEEASRRVGAVSLSRAIPVRVLVKPIAGAAAAAALWISVALFFPADAKTFFARFARPFSAQGYPARTRIVSVEAPDVIALGEAFEARALAEGVLPKEAAFVIRPARGTPRRVLVAGDEGRYLLVLETVRRDFTFNVRAGDAASAVYGVKVVPRPAVTALSARVEYPEYTGIGAISLSGGNVSALAGSRVTLEGKFNKPVESAALIFDGDDPLEGSLDEDHLSATFSFDIAESWTYVLRLVDAHGFDAERTAYTVTAHGDAAPRVALERPNRNLTAVAAAAVPVEASVADDYGVSDVVLCYSVTAADGSSRDGRLQLVPGPLPEASVSADYLWRLEALGLSPGDEVTYYVEALDNFPSEPQAGRSEVQSIRVVTVGEKLAEIERLNRQLAAELKRIAGRQSEVRRRVAAVAGGEGSP